MYGTIRLVIHITKIILRIVIHIVRSKLRPDILNVQYRFKEDRGTGNAIVVLSNLVERSAETQNEVYQCVIYYPNACEELINILQTLDINGKYKAITAHL